ncbi:hypothetical protein PTKIN_Ptkin06aG0096000 [Pterospermum kingtungense]
MNQDYFLELLNFLVDHNDDIKYVTCNAPENLKLISPNIQKDIVNVTVVKTMNIIMEEMGDALFFIQVDESCDISMKEQMAIVLRFVNKDGCVIEHFVGVEHVTSTTAFD